jgi:nuclease HARBI1
MVRQSGYSLKALRTRITRYRRALAGAVELDPTLNDYAIICVLLRGRGEVRRLAASIRLQRLRSIDISTTQFNLNAWDHQSSLRDFRLLPSEIGSKVAPFINFTRSHTRRSRYRVDPVFASCVVLRRLASPTRWMDLKEFYRHPSQLSEIFWEVIEHIRDTKFHLIQDFREDLAQVMGDRYAERIAAKCPIDNCFGFMDCTLVRTSRPVGPNAVQRSMYNGHKRCHGLKFQSVATPDGLIFHVFGPEEGRRHDSTLYRKSNMDAVLSESLLVNNRQLCLLADSAYTLQPWLQTIFSVTSTTDGQLQAFNTALSQSRVAVEWSYKDIRQTWTALDFKRKLKINESPVGLLWTTGCLLWNIKVVLGHGSQTGEHFDTQPPTWCQYCNIN